MPRNPPGTIAHRTTYLVRIGVALSRKNRCRLTPLTDRGHLPAAARPSRPRNPAAVVPCHNRTNHAGAPRALQPSLPLVRRRSRHDPEILRSRMLPEIQIHVLRRHRGRAHPGPAGKHHFNAPHQTGNGRKSYTHRSYRSRRGGIVTDYRRLKAPPERIQRIVESVRFPA